MQSDISSELDKVIASNHPDPFQVLGPHVLEDDPSSIIVRAFIPLADSVRIVSQGQKRYMYKMRKEGLFEIIVDNDAQAYDYFFEATCCNKDIRIFHDPYLFPVQLSDYDQHLFNQGCHYNIYEKIGAHIREINGIKGCIFRVWAPNARRASVIGNFNYWDGRCHQMRNVGSSGIWEIFIPGICQGEIYKYEIKTSQGNIIEKSDPFQFHGELPPKSASVVWAIDDYKWEDQAWLKKRERTSLADQPFSIYEVHAGSWQRDPANPERQPNFVELAETLIPYVKRMGFTHIEFMPIMEHTREESLGYHSSGYYSVTSRYGLPQDFMYFVDKCHQNDIGVILDWSPSNFPPDGHSLVKFDGTSLYEHGDSVQSDYPEPQLLQFNYGRKEVVNYLIANGLFWLDKFHVDGIRINNVTSILYPGSEGSQKITPAHKEDIDAIEFIKHLNSIIHKYYPDAALIAEESNSFYGITQPVDQGGLGFDFKWNLAWKNDVLSYFCRDPFYRKYHHNNLIFPLHYSFTERHILPFTHHDVVNGKGSFLEKMPGDQWQRFANLRALYLFLWTYPGKKMLFMGGEFGQYSGWNFKSSLDWHLLEESPYHLSLQHYLENLNDIYRANSPLWESDHDPEGFQWLDIRNVDNSIIAYSRFNRDRSSHIICLLNLTPQLHHEYKVGVPEEMSYRELLSTDRAEYGGSDVYNSEIMEAKDEPYAGAPYHVVISVPPLAGVILQPLKS